MTSAREDRAGGAAPTLRQLAYKDELERVAQGLGAPVLQIGSREQVIDRAATGRRSWHMRCGARAFVGVDLEAGDGVDAVVDICWPLERIRAALGIRASGASSAATCSSMSAIRSSRPPTS